MKKFINLIFRHKIIFGVILLAAAIGVFYGYSAYVASRPQPTRYVLGQASKGNIIATVSTTGQIAASNQLDVKAKAAGDVVAVYVKAGDAVKAGQLLASLDSTDAQKAVRDAQTSLETAELSLKNITDPPDALTLLQAQNALINAQNGKVTTQDNLNKSYSDAQNEISNAFLDFPDIMSGIQNNLYGNNLNKQQNNLDYMSDAAKVYDLSADAFRNSAVSDYQAARVAYDKNFLDYKNTGRTSDPAATTALQSETYATAKLISQAVLSANNLIQFYEDRLTEHGVTPSATADTLLAELNGFTSKINSRLTSLLGYTQSIKNYTQSLADADRTIAEKQASLAKTQSGASELDLRSAEISVDQKKNSLADARTALADYSIRAPWDGIIASFDLKKGDSLSTGGAAATIITKQLAATITLNEVDAVKVKIGNKATITFDAIDELSITGTVAQIDTIGSASQGVVSYEAQIFFDTQDARVRPGMSVSASIITQIAQDAIIVPSSAVKNNTATGTSYVLVPDEKIADPGSSRTGVVLAAQPREAEVQTGLSDGANTQIVSGLTEGEVIVVKTATGASAASSSSNSTRNLFQATSGAIRGGESGPPAR